MGSYYSKTRMIFGKAAMIEIGPGLSWLGRRAAGAYLLDVAGLTGFALR